MRAQPLPGLPDVLVIEPTVHRDHRGYFLETYERERYAESGVFETFVQDNHSFSSRGVLRGLHFQHPNGQAKLVWVVEGEVFDVAVDVRIGSPTFGRWVGRSISARHHQQLYIPAGFAHGFVVLSEAAHFLYKCSARYDPASERTLLWRDPVVGVAWPVAEPILSSKDDSARTLEDLRAAGDLPRYDS